MTRRPLSSVCWVKGMFNWPRLADRRQRNWRPFVAGDRDFSGHTVGGGHERRGGRRIRIADHQRRPAIATFADRLIDRDSTDERHAEVFGHLLPAAAPEYVRFVAAMGADEMTHVFNDAQRGDI